MRLSCDMLPLLPSFLLMARLFALARGCPNHPRIPEWPEGFWKQDNETEELYKRWYGIVYGDGSNVVSATENGFGRAWSQCTMSLCIDPEIRARDSDTYDAIEQTIRSAWNLWMLIGVEAGIESSWNLEVLTIEACTSDIINVTGPKQGYVWVQQSTGMDAALGDLQSGTIFSVQPPAQILSEWGAKGYTGGARIPILSYAHEIGHLMGLWHEQQHPSMWNPSSGGTLAGNNKFTLNCENFIGYAACQQYRTQQRNNNPFLGAIDMENMCSDPFAAIDLYCDDNENRLPSTEFLPPFGGEWWGRSSAKFDDKSIMLYPSNAWGQNGLNTYVYADGGGFVGRNDMVAPVFIPSPDDIRGSNFLCPMKATPFDNPPYFSSASDFNALYESQTRSGSCDASGSGSK